MQALKTSTLGLLLLIAAPAFAAPGAGTNSLSSLLSAPLKGAAPSQYVPFTMHDVVSGAPSSGAMVELYDGRLINAYTYLRSLNAVERELSAFGTTLRSTEANLGTVASVQTQPAKLTSILPDSTQQSAEESGWSHELSHAVASARSSGHVIQRQTSEASGTRFDRTTTHTIEGRFLDANTASIAQFIQRVVRLDSGEEQRETQVYINGRQVFRRGHTDAQEARIWKTAFDVPLKSVTIPIGPGSIDAKLGIRGAVNLDLELNPVTGPNSTPQIALDFRPQIIADGYVSGATTPTNVGDAGFEGAITLADDTLKIVGTAALSRAKWVDLKQVTVDNIFAGLNGRVYGFVNVKLPSRNADGGQKKHFEKEFYKWDGIKVEKRLYEYNAQQPQPQPQPAPQPPAI